MITQRLQKLKRDYDGLYNDCGGISKDFRGSEEIIHRDF